MKNIAVLPNRQKTRAAAAAADAVRFLRRCGLRVLAETENRDIVDADEYRSIADGLFAACDAAVVFGGDGTLLRSTKEAYSDYDRADKIILVAPGELPQ